MKKPDKPEKTLRQRAEESQQKNANLFTDGKHAMSTAEEQSTLHELRVHQIELEMQNEELRRAQIEVELARARYFDLYDLAPVGYFTVSEQGIIIEANLTLSTLLGVARDALVRQPIFRFIFNSDQDTYYLYRKALVETSKPQQCELRMVKKDNTVFWAHLSATLQTDANGVILCRAVLSEITDRKLAEVALKESEERFQKIFQSSPCIIAISQMQDGRILDVNDAFCQVSGYSKAEAIASTSLCLDLWVNLADRDLVTATLKYGKKVANKEFQLRKKNGEMMIGLYSCQLIQIGSQAVILSNILDITERKLADNSLTHAHDLMRYIIEHDKSAIAVLNRDLKYLYVSQRYLDDYRIKDQNIIGKYHYEVFPDLPQKWKDVHQRALAGEISSAEDDPYPREDGSMDWIRWECRPWYEADGSIGGIIIYTEVITERKKLELSLAHEYSLLRTTLISVGDGVISTDHQSRIRLVNRVAETLTGWTQETARGKPIAEVFTILDEYSRQKSKDIVCEVLTSGKTIEILTNTILIAKDGTERSIEHNAAPIVQENGETIGVVLAFRDATEKRKKLAEIEYLSYHDHLTGLYNRRHFDDTLRKIEEEKSSHLALLMADVNGLKLTNDAFGHRAGDIILEKVANILKRECRVEDVVSRVGGDEFAILLPETDSENADKLISRINAAIAEEKIENITLSVSIGYAVKQNPTDHVNDIYKQAEEEMYRHKLSESSSMRSKTINLILNTLYAKSNREMSHSNRVSELCVAIASQMNFSRSDIEQIRITGQMHDIGKIGVDEAILACHERLNSDQWKQIEKHPEIGFRILSSVNEFSLIANDVLCHHEKFDGSGYPQHLKGTEISLQARIIAVADAFDAMTRFREYRSSISEDEAILELKRCAGTHFDPAIAKVFVEKVLKKEWD